ncbi:hypothetical protein F4824DRAFT_512960 [Ustulina deusta]|nr:hypothetical protein F4824DRAFT_512960 [Ustulina deusta]
MMEAGSDPFLWWRYCWNVRAAANLPRRRKIIAISVAMDDMFDFGFDFFDGSSANLECRTLEFANFNYAKAHSISEQDQLPSSEPLEQIHYDFRWKVSQRDNIRARQVCSGSSLMFAYHQASTGRGYSTTPSHLSNLVTRRTYKAAISPISPPCIPVLPEVPLSIKILESD